MTGVGFVLILGRDAFLLETRRQVLESEGYRVVLAGSASEMSQQLAAGPISLLIICHTVPTTELEALLNACWGPKKLLAVVDSLIPPKSN